MKVLPGNGWWFRVKYPAVAESLQHRHRGLLPRRKTSPSKGSYALTVSRTQRLATVLLLSLGLVTALVVVGLAAHSLAVLAAGAGYLADAVAIGASLVVVRRAARPFSYQDATTVAALFSAGWLLMLNIGIAVVAIQRLATGTHRVEGSPCWSSAWSPAPSCWL